MTRLIVTTREQRELAIDADPGAGLSIMQIIRDAGLVELLALCGGGCSCGTCHVFVEGPADVSLPPMGMEEIELLESTGLRQANSRLSCQIVFAEAMDGLRLRIAPEP